MATAELLEELQDGESWEDNASTDPVSRRGPLFPNLGALVGSAVGGASGVDIWTDGVAVWVQEESPCDCPNDDVFSAAGLSTRARRGAHYKQSFGYLPVGTTQQSPSQYVLCWKRDSFRKMQSRIGHLGPPSLAAIDELYWGISCDPCSQMTVRTDRIIPSTSPVAWNRDDSPVLHEFSQAVIHHQRVEIESRLRRVIEQDDVVDGLRHPGEEIVRDIARLIGDKVDSWSLNAVREASPLSHAAAMLTLVSRCGLPRAIDQRRSIVSWALRQEDVELRDTAIQACENWEDDALVDVLTDHHERVSWLRDYLERVVVDLRS